MPRHCVLDLLEYPFAHCGQRHRRGVEDHCSIRNGQGRQLTTAVFAASPDNVRQDRVEIVDYASCPLLVETPAGAYFGGRVQVYLDDCLRDDNAANVPANHHHARSVAFSCSILTCQATLLNAESCAHPRVS